MDWLRAFATFDCSLSLLAMAERLNAAVPAQVEGDELQLKSAQMQLTVIECGSGEYLLRGEVQTFRALEALLPRLLHLTDALQLDLFEEDGRLVRRISHPQGGNI